VDKPRNDQNSHAYSIRLLDWKKMSFLMEEESVEDAKIWRELSSSSQIRTTTYVRTWSSVTYTCSVQKPCYKWRLLYTLRMLTSFEGVFSFVSASVYTPVTKPIGLI
jgi:hypothetical protein